MKKLILLLTLAASFFCLILSGCGSETAEVPEVQETPAPVEETVIPAPEPVVTVLGKEYKPDTSFIDLSDCADGDTQEIIAGLSGFEALNELNLLKSDGTCNFTLESLNEIKTAYPELSIDCSFELFGQQLSSKDENIEYEEVEIGNEGIEEFRKAIPLLSSCDRLLISNCGIDYELLSELKSDFPETKVVWSVNINGHDHLTDIERIRTTEITNDISPLLKYFTDVKYIDMGHMRGMTDWEFLSYMPDLEILIVSLTFFDNDGLAQLKNCQKLSFLEMFSCRVTDISVLAEIPSLEYLNIGNLPGISDITPLYGLSNLKRLRICQDKIPQEQMEEIAQVLPDCEMLFGGGHPGFGGQWRYYKLDDYSDQNCVDIYLKIRYIFDYLDYPNYRDYEW